MAEIVVREAAGGEDIDAVRRLMRAYGDYLAAAPGGAAGICIDGYERELERLPAGYTVLLLARVDGDAAGCVALRTLRGVRGGCEMKRLWVEREFRGLGLGKRLVDESIAWAKRMGFEAMYLDTVPAAMPEANRLYAGMGFVLVERYNANPLTGVVFFRKELGGCRSGV
jgi:GNAT superfamily N-acetyltransferase